MTFITTLSKKKRLMLTFCLLIQKSYLWNKKKMYCIVSKNGEEVNTENNGANISMDFKEYENVFFDKKLRTHKMKKNSKQTT